MSKRFRLFAGPNGSGKTSLVDQIQKKFNLGYFINADTIERDLAQKGFLICADFSSVEINQKSWEDFIQFVTETDARLKQYPNIKNAITITEGILTIKEITLNSYLAAIIAEFFRFTLLKTSSSFSFETVMSHSSKISFINAAKEKGFKTYLYFVCTKDPTINKNRVKIRVRKGGHDVDEGKIESRYYRSLELLCEAFLVSDRAFIMDNSTDEQELFVLVEKNGKNITVHSDLVPEWIETYLLEKL